jgi:hypothetical protein
MEKVITIHLSSIPCGALVVTIWVCTSTQWEKSVSLSHWLPYTPHGAFVALVLGVDPMEKCFCLPNIHPTIHPSKPSILHTLQLWQLVHSQTDYPVPCGGCEPNGKVFCVHPPSIPHGFFWLFVFVIFRPQSTSTHQCTREGWMVSGHETVFCWVSVPLLTMVVNSVASF